MTWLDDLVRTAQDNLLDSEADLLYARGVSPEQIQLFKLGFLSYGLPDRDYPKDFQTWAARHKDKFENSFLIPLTNTRGSLLGFQLRSANPSKKGYIDYFLTDEEPVLFGLSQAMQSVWETGSIWLVEGAFDLFPVQRHRPNVVATLHAGISAGFQRVLSRLVDDVYLAWDNDAAGRKHSYDLLKAPFGQKHSIHIIKFPELPLGDRKTKDPNELWSVWGDAKLGVFLDRQ